MVINRTMSFKRLACLELHGADVVRVPPALAGAAHPGGQMRPGGRLDLARGLRPRKPAREFAASHPVTVDSLNKA